MSISKTLLTKGLSLKPVDKLMFIQALNASLDKPDSSIDELWINEVINRMDAFESGKAKAISFEALKKL